MKTYNLIGYLIILSYFMACLYFAPAHLGPWAALLRIGGVYFIFFAGFLAGCTWPMFFIWVSLIGPSTIRNGSSKSSLS